MGEMLLSDIPDETIRSLSGPLHNYTTALFRVTGTPPRNLDAVQIGSGTFASVGEVHGILTAQHVAAEIDRPCWLGIAAGREGQEHHMRVDRSAIQVTDIGRRLSDEYGPDLAFISLADWNNVSTIMASRAFLPLQSDSVLLLNDPPEHERGIWFICGAPGERLHTDAVPHSFDTVMSYEDLALAGGPSAEFSLGNHDYIELGVEPGPSIPASIAGMSGGGLWQVLVGLNPDGHIVALRYLLVGTTFYQGVRPSGARYVRCHGRHDIYAQLVHLVASRGA